MSKAAMKSLRTRLCYAIPCGVQRQFDDIMTSSSSTILSSQFWLTPKQRFPTNHQNLGSVVGQAAETLSTNIGPVHVGFLPVT